MNLPRIADSSVKLIATGVKCPRCGGTSKIARALCVNCLLQNGLDEDEQETDSLDALLSEIPVRDTDWQLGNYQILEEIGRGGMGVIYRARQKHSCRVVAIKRVLGYHADSPDTLERFRREAQAAASLDHPNILPIYEVGASDGLPFFSMKLATGGSFLELKRALRDQPRRCVAMMARVARAVHHAHTQGILHRDLKPGNILLDARGEPLVSDFGLAKWLDTTSDLTRTLTIFGTPGYIAPEQARGQRETLKPSADVYSLGAILFELFVGRPPFLGEHALAVIKQAEERTAPRLRTLRPDLDRDLETICAKCLEREPTARYSGAGDLAQDLEHWLDGRSIVARPVLPPVKLWRWSKRNPVLAGSLGAVLLIGALAITHYFETRGLAETVREQQLAAHSIAILPFLDLDTAQRDVAFAKSLEDALRAETANFGTAQIITVTDGVAAIPGAGNLADLRTISRQIRCRAVLAGTVRWAAGKRRVSLRLNNVETGDTLFERVSDPSSSKSPTLEVAAGIARSLFSAMNGPARIPNTVADPATTDPATNEFLRAGDDLMMRRSIADIDRALICYERVINLQPKSAIARAAFTIAAIQKMQLGSGSPTLLQKAARFAREAEALNPAIAPTHRALGGLLFFVERNISAAREEALRTIEAGALSDGPALLGMIDKMRGRPDLALRWYGINSHWRIRPADDEFVLGDCWADLGEDARAEKMYQRVAALHPELPDGWIGLCRLRLLANDFVSARELCQKNKERDLQSSYSAQIAAQVEFFSRNYADAEKLYRDLEQTDPGGGGSFYGAVSYQSALGRLLTASGDGASARATLLSCLDRERKALVTAPHHPEILYRAAAIESSLGEIDAALTHLRLAAASGWLDYRSLVLDPRFDSLRQDSRYSSISEAMATRVASLRRSQSTDNND